MSFWVQRTRTDQTSTDNWNLRLEMSQTGVWSDWSDSNRLEQPDFESDRSLTRVCSCPKLEIIVRRTPIGFRQSPLGLMSDSFEFYATCKTCLIRQQVLWQKLLVHSPDRYLPKRDRNATTLWSILKTTIISDSSISLLLQVALALTKHPWDPLKQIRPYVDNRAA